MKSNLAILSSDIKSINFIIKNDLESYFHLYANSSRNIKDAENFSKKYNFAKYFGSYEELIEDNNIEYIINFLPSGIKFEYTYLLIKKGLKVISNYPIVSSLNEIDYLNEIQTSKFANNLFLIDDNNFNHFKLKAKNKKYLTYFQDIKLTLKENNSLSTMDILFESCPDLLFYLDSQKERLFKISNIDLKKNTLTNSIDLFRCIIEIEPNIKIFVILVSNNVENIHSSNFDALPDLSEKIIYNFEDFEKFISGKKPFDNLSYFQYYPLKLLQEAINE